LRFLVNLGILLVLAAGALAQSDRGFVRLQKLDVADDQGAARLELTLSAPLTYPQVSTETHPDRLVLELPGAVPGEAVRLLPWNRDSVKTIQVVEGKPSSEPVTRVVVELKSRRAYDLSVDGNRIVLTVLAEGEASNRTPPAAAASAPIFGRRHRDTSELPQTTPNSNPPSEIVPPPALPPISFPGEPVGAKESASAAPPASVAPSATTGAPAPAPPPEVQGASLAPAVAPQGEGTGQNTPYTPSSEADAQAAAALQANPDVKIAFRVKYVAEGVAYLEGGRNDGLSEGMKLEVKAIDPAEKVTAAKSADVQPIAELEVASVALSSAVSEVHNPTRPVMVGDWAYLSSEDTQALIAQRSLSATRKYPVVIAFSENDTLDDEARVVIPRPPLPEINRARGRIGFDYSGVSSHDAGGGLSSNAGLMIRTDITRINGTHWNLNGFWRGRINNQSHAGQATLQDLINRTYTIGMTYDNPNSRWVAGFGRLYLPWATSLDSIDGGYFGRRLSQSVTAGIFAGSTPDPTSWSYDPNRRIGGAFVNFQGGSFDNLRYTSTSGMGLGLLKWKIDRPFVFFENGIFYKRYLSIYHSLQADSPSGNPQVAAPGAGVSRSYLNIRVQPASRVEFDLNHTYFRDIPTYNAQLVGTGLLDKYLFQGFSGGVRVRVFKDIWTYTQFGRSNRSSDAKPSWNQLYGVTMGRVPWIGMRADVHYSKFDSAFGNGSYESVSLSRNLNDNLRWEVLGGRQAFLSSSIKDISHFVTGNFEAALGPHYFVQTGYTWNRGQGQNYDQWLFTFGYRFDNRSKGR
jgi:hypothetical protein